MSRIPGQFIQVQSSIPDMELALARGEDRAANLFVSAMNNLQGQVVGRLGIAQGDFQRARNDMMTATHSIDRQITFTIGEELSPNDPVRIEGTRLYHADGLFLRLPTHMREHVREVRQWEKMLTEDRDGTAGVYADWCEEHDWSQRAGELRTTPPGNLATQR